MGDNNESCVYYSLLNLRDGKACGLHKDKDGGMYMKCDGKVSNNFFLKRVPDANSSTKYQYNIFYKNDDNDKMLVYNTKNQTLVENNNTSINKNSSEARFTLLFEKSKDETVAYLRNENRSKFCATDKDGVVKCEEYLGPYLLDKFKFKFTNFSGINFGNMFKGK